MITDEQILKSYEEFGSKTAAAEHLGMPRTNYRRRFARAQKVEVQGVMPGSSLTDVDELIRRLLHDQDRKEHHIRASRSQTIIVKEDKPFVLALFADLHIGNNKSDYKALVRDTELVRDCPYCYALTAGDHSENWIGKLGWIAREQSMSLDAEHSLVKWWFDQMRESLIAVCSGNHDNRSIINSGIDYIRNVIFDAVLLYDQDQILFTLAVGGARLRFKIRHKDQYRSILNPFHGAMRDIERGDSAWDIYISGHDHKGTMFADFVHHDSPKKVCRLGTYKIDDRYGKFLGFAKSYGTGSGALVITPEGDVQSYADIGLAIQCCEAMRGGV